MRTDYPGSESSRELSFPGANVPENFHSRERKFSVGTFTPRSKNTEERKVPEPWPDLSSVTWPVFTEYNMADIAEEVIAACSILVLAAGLGAATILNKRKKNESTQHGLNHTSESEHHLERTTPFCRSWPQMKWPGVFSTYEWTLQLLRSYFCTLKHSEPVANLLALSRHVVIASAILSATGF